MKIGVIDVGGGIRGIYATGVLDYCIDNNINFDFAIGISAGSANLSSFLAHQRGRNYTFYTEYYFRKKYASLRNFIFKKSYVDMEYVYGELCKQDGENPLDYMSLRNNPTEFLIIATEAETGEAKYFDKSDLSQDNYDPLKASSTIPFVCKPYEINGVKYFDGALSDSIPVKKAFACGCDIVILLLTKPEGTIRTSKKDCKIARFIRKKYPKAAERLCNRAKQYNDGIALAQEYAKQGKLLIVAPDDTLGVDTLSKDKKAIKKLYEKGYNDGIKIKEFLLKCYNA